MAFLKVTGKLNGASPSNNGTCVAVEAWVDSTHKMRPLFSFVEPQPANAVPTVCEWYGLLLTTANINEGDPTGEVHVTDLDSGIEYKCNAIDITDADLLGTVTLTAV